MQIEQIDRDAAAELLGGAAPDGLREGRRDSLSLVQAFAAHRIAAQPLVTDANVSRAVMASVKLGAWMSAALDDPNVCDAMKADIREWFSAGEPVSACAAAIAALGEKHTP